MNLEFFIFIAVCFSYEVPNMYYTFQVVPLSIFKQMWPGSICLEKQCYKEYIGDYKGKSWAIHGLWPSTKNGACKTLKFCTSEKFNSMSKETNISLDQVWVGFYQPTELFRKHEWDKHGTCWDQNDDLFEQEAGMSNQEEYFITTYELLEIYNIYHILKKSGITPDDKKFYYTDDILSAIRLNMKIEAQLHCVKDSNKNLLLYSISFCFDEIYRPRNCPCKVHGLIHCGENNNDKIRYPIFR